MRDFSPYKFLHYILSFALIELSDTELDDTELSDTERQNNRV